MTLSPAHAHIIALAQRTFTARDDRSLWKKGPETAIATHGEACDALWKELEDQVAAQDGQLPVLEMPSVRQIRMAKRLRDEIIAAVQGAVVEALDDIISGALADEVGG
jgi:hypothetical protein